MCVCVCGTPSPQYFRRVRVSGGAAMKMVRACRMLGVHTVHDPSLARFPGTAQLMHAHSGVEKGISKGGKPIEIMGLMVGRVDTSNDGTVLVTDVRTMPAPYATTCTLAELTGVLACMCCTCKAFALPVEGTETAVLSSSPEVTNHMIAVCDSLERVRWHAYRSYPVHAS